jgi:hypothetical protein
VACKPKLSSAPLADPTPLLLFRIVPVGRIVIVRDSVVLFCLILLWVVAAPQCALAHPPERCKHCTIWVSIAGCMWLVSCCVLRCCSGGLAGACSSKCGKCNAIASGIPSDLDACSSGCVRPRPDLGRFQSSVGAHPCSIDQAFFSCCFPLSLTSPYDI